MISGRPTAGQPGQVGMIELGGGAGGLSVAYRLQHLDSITATPWVGSSELQVAARPSGQEACVTPTLS